MIRTKHVAKHNYDGANSMTGKTKGAAAHITSLYPLALCTHCASHSLNLAVVASFEETAVQNMIGVVNRLTIFFFAYPKRQKKLEEAINITQPQSRVHKLKDLCRTRWVERIDALDRVISLYLSIVACIETIRTEGSLLWSPDSVTDSSTLLSAIKTTEFLSALVITSECFQNVRGLTVRLQEEAKDIVQAVSEITTLISTLKDVRNNLDFYHSKWFRTIESMCSEVGPVPSMPRLCGRQQHKPSTPASDPLEYYRRVISVPLVDHLLSELERRFTHQQETALQGQYLVLSDLVTESPVTISNTVKKVGEFYSADLQINLLSLLRYTVGTQN